MLRSTAAITAILLLGFTANAGQQIKPRATKAVPKSEKTGKQVASKEKTNTQSGVVVAVDPTTRQIREPNADELRALAQSGAASAPANPPQTIQGPQGAVGVVLGPEFQTFTVVTRTPDGQVRMEEVNGETAAKERVGSKEKSKPENER